MSEVSAEAFEEALANAKAALNDGTREEVEAVKTALEEALAKAKQALIDGISETVKTAEAELVEAYNALEEKVAPEEEEEMIPEEGTNTGDTTNVAGLLAMLLASAYEITRRKKV